MKRLIAPKQKLSSIAVALALAGMAAVPLAVQAQTATNPVDGCQKEAVFYNPGNGEDIVIAQGYKIEPLIRGLNFPTDVAFSGNKNNFQILVLESGTGLPGRCNNNELVPVNPADATGPKLSKFDARNPLTPDILIFDRHGNKVAGPLGKPTSDDVTKNNGFQPDGPAIGLAFENETRGKLFGTDSNQGARGAAGRGNNTSRVVRIDLPSGKVNTVIKGLPTGDHPTEQIVVKNGWLYWSQGSATNAGVTGLDNGNGGNQHEIACERIQLSAHEFRSKDPLNPSGTVSTSGFSNFGHFRPLAFVDAFEDATSPGMCTGAILRARISDPQNTIEPVAWGFRNPYGLRFSPNNHPLKGQLLISENGEDERGARPVANAPDRVAVARQGPNGRPEFHGWPDRFGFLDSTQSVFNPETAGDAAGTAFENQVNGQTVPHVLNFMPQQPVMPLALDPEDVAAVGLDFVPDDFATGIVKRNAVLLSREGDFGFTGRNGSPIVGHDVELINFTKADNPNELTLTRFAFNCPKAQQRHDPDGTPQCVAASPDDKVITPMAFAGQLRGINRPTTIRFGPDGAAYLVDYGAVRDPGGSDIRSRFVNPANAPLVQIPGTGTIWKITRIGGNKNDKHDDDDD
jgi:glucose/arabinose dehydrogenase